MNPPVLMPPTPHKPLLLYISLTDKSLCTLLVQENDQGKERGIYYINHTLVNYELNYIFIEKSCLVIVFSSQKLHHCLLAYKIKLISKFDPLKYLLNKTMLMGRFTKLVMILSEFIFYGGFRPMR